MRYDLRRAFRTGRLAQPVEHLVYTERVGGSNPSPPTSPRLARAGWLLAVAVASAWIGLSWAALPALAAEPMSFQIERIQSSGTCRHHRCSAPVTVDAIGAQGEINNDTSGDFVAFLQEHVQDPNLRPLVLIHSPGGTVVGAMQLGLAFRRINAVVVVARTVGIEGSDQAHIAPGYCMSACVYAFFGGARRVVIPSVGRLGIHRMAIYARSRDPAGGEATTRTFGSSDLVTALAQYTKEMGVDPGVIDEAETIAPESIHIVTAREIARWRIATPHL